MSFAIIIRGPLGCGKTTLAKGLSAIIGARYFSVDAVLEENSLDKEWETGYISQRSFLKANAIIAAQARESMDSGTCIVIDGNFYWRSQMDDLVGRLGIRTVIFTLRASLELCVKRDSSRECPHGQKAAEDVYQKSVSFDEGIIIDAERPPRECISEMLAALRERGWFTGSFAEASSGRE